MTDHPSYRFLPMENGQVGIEFDEPLIDFEDLPPQLQNAVLTLHQTRVPVYTRAPLPAPTQAQPLAAPPAACVSSSSSLPPIQKPSSTPSSVMQVDNSELSSNHGPAQVPHPLLICEIPEKAERVPEDRRCIVSVVTQAEVRTTYNKEGHARRVETVFLQDASGARISGVNFPLVDAPTSPKLQLGAKLDVSGAKLIQVKEKYIRNGIWRQIYLGDDCIVQLNAAELAQQQSATAAAKKRKYPIESFFGKSN